MPIFVDGPRGKPDAPRKEGPPPERVTLENFGRLRVGMSLQALEAILGTGRQATDDDDAARWLKNNGLMDTSTLNAWIEAVKQARVRLWESRALRILAAFPDVPTSGSKVEVILRITNTSYGGWRDPLQQPADRWAGVSKDSFLRLKVGMTFKELEDILGKSERVGYFPKYTFAGGDKSPNYKAWDKAVKGYRVCRWRKWGVASDSKPGIWAAFPEPPSATTKVEALLYRDGVWDEDRGSLSAEPAVWKEITPKSNAFTVKMPGEVKETTQYLPSGGGKLTVYTSSQPTSNYIVAVGDLPDATVRKGAGAYFAERTTYFRSLPGVRIHWETTIKSGAHAGREWLLDRPMSGKMKVRMFLIGKRSVMLQAGPVSVANEADLSLTLAAIPKLYLPF